MARQMVVNYGFSDIGPWSLLDQNAQSGDMIMRMMARNSTSESLQRKIDSAVKKIATEAYEVALNHIRRAPAAPPKLCCLRSWVFRHPRVFVVSLMRLLCDACGDQSDAWCKRQLCELCPLSVWGCRRSHQRMRPCAVRPVAAHW